jgi:hypothetical protein
MSIELGWLPWDATAQVAGDNGHCNGPENRFLYKKWPLAGRI